MAKLFPGKFETAIPSRAQQIDGVLTNQTDTEKISWDNVTQWHISLKYETKVSSPKLSGLSSWDCITKPTVSHNLAHSNFQLIHHGPSLQQFIGGKIVQENQHHLAMKKTQRQRSRKIFRSLAFPRWQMMMWLWRLISPTFQNKTYPENWPPRHDLTHPIWLANFRAAVLDSIHLLFLNGICTKKYRSLSKYIHELRVRTYMGEISPSLKIRGSNAWESKSPPCHQVGACTTEECGKVGMHTLHLPEIIQPHKVDFRWIPGWCKTWIFWRIFR